MRRLIGSIMLSGAILAFGVAAPCRAAEATDGGDGEADIKASLAKLSKADRELAKAQRFCPITGDRLGLEDTPVKVMVNNKAVFVCCDDCQEDVAADPQGIVAIVDKLKKTNTALAKLSAADRKIAEEQRFCAVNTENELGSMGTPVKVTVEGQTVFLCCNGCKNKALSNSKRTLNSVKRLKAHHGHG